MSGFSAEWLALREPADAAARSAVVTGAIVEAMRARNTVRVADLGSGTGSNVRYLSLLLPDTQEWRLIDNDSSLLAVARQRIDHRVETSIGDLRDLDDALLGDRDLVTASALLDLVSEDWLARIVRQCRHAGACVLVALNYDGRISCSPEDPDDRFVRDLVNRHQRTDKGLGPALGPDSGARAAALLRDAGYLVTSAKSDWVLGPEQQALQSELIAGWGVAAAELMPADTARIAAWQRRRSAAVAAGSSRVTVGHDDVAGVLQAAGEQRDRALR